ncbi:endonuclease [Psychromonas sp. SP041]|uniref:endonuclease n=1 Tax=Psychromonas sp. SP041 TaxID=1365007 RepID=UPI0010C7B474|nr:endonuclease [Psychromonas sp. SP041]
MKTIATIIILSLFSFEATAKNETNQSFSKAKKQLETGVYSDNRVTLYCGASFDAKKNITPPTGFHTDKYIKRSKRVEWEHIVPAENFGRTFKEWRDGDALCVSSKGKSFKGRKCAEKVNNEYRYMQADMHNLFPAIGAVNALRSNYNFQMQPGVESDFGSCAMKINDRKAEPPVDARGRIARAYLYMDEAYSRYNMSSSQKQLMTAWDKMYPVSAWECMREKNIADIQKNNNIFVQRGCE